MPAKMPKKIPEKKVTEAIEQLDKKRSEWMRRPGVTAVDVGYKITDGRITDDLALRIHVQRKKSAAELPEYERFTLSGAPETVGGFPLDVIEAEYGITQGGAGAALQPEPVQVEPVGRKERVEPLIGGTSCGNPRITAGTIGAIVFDRADGQACILSNWHVLCGDPSCQAGEAIWQPGKADGGSGADKVAELRRWQLNKHMDAALAKLTGQRAHSRDILGLDPVPGMEEAQLGMPVKKSGRTTGVTEGVIDGVSSSVSIDYGSAGVVTLTGQIHIVPRPPWPGEPYEVSMGGDSGSVWIHEETGMAIGLHFAGEISAAVTAENAIANPIQRVAQELDFSFTPVFVTTPGPTTPAPTPRMDDPRVRLILLRHLCRYFPWLCFRSPFQPFGPQAESPQQNGGRIAELAATSPLLEVLVHDILEDLQKS